MKTTIYDVDYFISKFEAIPEDRIGVATTVRRCALWHCNSTIGKHSEEAEALVALLKSLNLRKEGLPIQDKELIYSVNDGLIDNQYNQSKAKQRILAALADVKKLQQPAEPKEKIIYKTVVIDTAVHELQKQLTEN